MQIYTIHNTHMDKFKPSITNVVVFCTVFPYTYIFPINVTSNLQEFLNLGF